MENSNMKNMVVLRDLPSNIVEEAIIVLKSNKKVKKLQKIEKLEKQNNNEKKDNKEKDYILKEAEMLVNSYISKVENKNKVIFKKENKKYTKLKRYTFIISLISVLEFIVLLIK